MFRSTSSFDRNLEKATNERLLEADLEAILEICDSIRSGEIPPKYAVGAIKKKLYHQNPHVSLFALQVLESCVKNCGSSFHVEITTRTFMEELRDLAKITTNETLRSKIVELIATWAHAFRSDPSCKAVQDTMNIMKAEGFKFPHIRESDAMYTAAVAPQWADGDSCYRCRVQFGLVQRKHHCRHCGQVFCDRCSSKTSTIPKFGIEKEVRVCDKCYELNQTVPLSVTGRSKSESKSDHHHKSEKSTTPSSSSTQPAKASAPQGKSEAELQEEEELQMAIALSKSEAEAKEQERQRRSLSFSSTSSMSNSSTPSSHTTKSNLKSSSSTNNTVTNGILKTIEPMKSEDPELSRYLDREYWEQKQWQSSQSSSTRRSSSPAPSAPSHHQAIKSSMMTSSSSANTSLSSTMNASLVSELESMKLSTDHHHNDRQVVDQENKTIEIDNFVSTLQKAIIIIISYGFYIKFSFYIYICSLHCT